MMAKLFIGRANTTIIDRVNGILFLRLLSQMPSTVVIGILGITVLRECGRWLSRYRLCHLLRVVRIEHEADVKIAVSGMTNDRCR